MEFKFVHEKQTKTNLQKYFPPFSLTTTSNAESQKKVSKGLYLKEDDRALPLWHSGYYSKLNRYCQLTRGTPNVTLGTLNLSLI